MFNAILKREIQQNLYSLRFQISFLAVTVIFIVGTLSFLKGYETTLEGYSDYQSKYIEQIQEEAEANATRLAVNRKTYLFQPRENAFISDCKETYLPNAIEFSAWNVFSFQSKSGSSNPFLAQFQELNWSFIVSMILSFIVFLLTFDSISGEKELGTLSLTLSNAFSKGTLLLGKYVSAVLTAMLMAVIGMILSVLIILFSNQVAFSSALALELMGFVFILFLMISVMASFGLLSSVLVRNSNISLLIALTFWLFFAVVIPNSSTLFAQRFFSIEHEETIHRNVMQAYEDINRNAPDGSWSMNSSNPFTPEHELRADLMQKRMNAEKEIRDAYYQDMFRQFERTRLLTAVSPIALFECMVESVISGGYPRLKNIWTDMHIYQNQLLDFFKDIDARDPDSPHWYNPLEDVSTTRKPVAFEAIPHFEEKSMSFSDRISSVFKYLTLNLIYVLVVFLLTFVLFVRYDVR
jgi:ABC-type transport system involved in multi-copper enzyme maturation permease subunit